jgi:hypothetical protein
VQWMIMASGYAVGKPMADGSTAQA